MKLNKIYNENCIDTMSRMENESVDLVVTSPPYYNVRDYSKWDNLDLYYDDMKNIYTNIYRVLGNHKYFILNVGDIVSHISGSKWNKRKIMLGARFICMLEDIGFQIIDDIIWDKGEPQTKRHLGNPPYPYYQKPINCYEHIIIAEKNIIDMDKPECPCCNKKIIVSNSMSKINVQSWECKNPECKCKSKSNRGKRFSKRSIMMDNAKKDDNEISEDMIKKWRRDIVKLNPVIKINQNGVNIKGHSAPYPQELTDMAILFFSCSFDIVYDPFMGSGTTAISCLLNNRNYIGSEISSDYVKIAEERINNFIKI